MSETKKYEVTVKEKKGTCDNELFELMAKEGDITATKISELLDMEVTITGYAKCHIETNDKSFDINYYDTEEYGLISSGSEIFAESVTKYFGKVKTSRVTKIKTRQGITYKAVPQLKKKIETINNNEETTNIEDLPF